MNRGSIMMPRPARPASSRAPPSLTATTYLATTWIVSPVSTDSERALKSQKLVLELLQSDMPEAEYTRHNELDHWSARLEIGKPRFAARKQPA